MENVTQQVETSQEDQQQTTELEQDTQSLETQPTEADQDQDTQSPETQTVVEESTTPDVVARGGSGFSFVDMLVEARMLSQDQAVTAQGVAQKEGIRFWQVLVRDGVVMPQDLAALMALHLGISMVDLRNQTIDPQAVACLPEQVARGYGVLPIQMNNNHLTIAMADPSDLRQIQDLSACTGRIVEPVVATADDIWEHIEISYRLIENPTQIGLGGAKGSQERITATSLQEVQPAQIVSLILQQGVHDRASDIHIEPGESRLRIRFRIDGILHDIMTLPPEQLPPIISRLKIMAGMNIAERRRAQDGQFTVEVQNRDVDVRVAISSSVNGEMAVLRLLDKGFTIFGLNQLGMSPQILDQYRQLLRLPYGMIIICGPTGSGKSTSLYASLLQMDRVEQKVISIEDPVEYRINDVNQTQVHQDAGITFASQLRSILRLDPDVIMVGEVRDEETATIATQAALTGHLVLTSLHANDSIAALVRLRDLGVPTYLISSSVAGIVAQRMVRVVCSSCQAMTPRPLAEQKAYASVMGEIQEQFIYGSGCNMCAQTGYRGRSGAFEILTMGESLRRLFLADGSREDLWAQALKEGLVPIRRDGMLKVKAGITTPYEVMRVLYSLD